MYIAWEFFRKSVHRIPEESPGIVRIPKRPEREAGALYSSLCILRHESSPGR